MKRVRVFPPLSGHENEILVHYHSGTRRHHVHGPHGTTARVNDRGDITVDFEER